MLKIDIRDNLNDEGLVVGIEHMKELYNFGIQNISKHHKNLLDSKKIKLILGDGRIGYSKEAPYDCIHVGAVADKPPDALLKQLKVGGRLVMPLYNNNNQFIYIIDKKNDSFNQTEGLSVCYVPLTDAKFQMLGKNS